MERCNWAVLGCGTAANEFAQAMGKGGRCPWGVANRTYDNAVAFAQRYGVPKVYPDIEDVFHDDEVDIIYIATPHDTHADYLTRALRCGKHVLCEKSITLNSAELSAAMELAREKGLVLAEAMTLYHMPLYERLHAFARSGALGPLRMIQVSFGSYKGYDMTNRFFDPNQAGGALLDIGVYALSFARWFMSERPDRVLSQVKLAPSGVDEQAGILLMDPSQEMAAITLSLHAKQPKRGVAVYDRGYIEIWDYPRAEKATIVYTQDGRRETIEAGRTADALLYEIEDMERAVSGEEDGMYLGHTADVMDVMTAIRREWGLVYPKERP